MLKALELSGFKSFADKTRFEFPAGITVVVGPNGSGKSNIVDAIKWVLGEQSAKSLRGKEMADVIFKGSGGPTGRKPSNSATATLVLDNADRRFSFDADEVLVSRRVYRSGEAEYLINNDACRLKDIRDMFRGTGIGTDAYSLIEQGKVDRLLQASAKERRAIFEEAAGISRFKAKKIEAQRRLDRVEGNLIRLSDIVEEVGSRYRSIKNQAAKAARYKEFSNRLQELRTYVGQKDWRQISQQLQKLQNENSALSDKSQELKSKISDLESAADKIEKQLEAFSKQVAEKQQQVLKSKEAITEHKASISLNETRLTDLESRKADLNLQMERMRSRQDEIETRLTTLKTEVVRCEESVSRSTNQVQELEADLQESDANVDKLSSENSENIDQRQSLLDKVSALGQAIAAAESEVKASNSQKKQRQETLAELDSKIERQRDQIQEIELERESVAKNAESKDLALKEAREFLDAARAKRSTVQREWSNCKDLLTEKTQRRKVLLELEKKLEGVNAGAKQLLDQAKSSESGPYKEIIGVVADMLAVNVQHAGIVDVALGNAAQYIVVDGDELIDLVKKEKLKVKGRVGFVQFNDPPTMGADPNVSINGEPGVIGRADRLVQVRSEYATFVRKLLGGTWVVKTLEHAVSIYERNLGQVRMVSLDGEIVEADGTIIVGPKAIATGLVSRRSELRLLTKEIEELTLKSSELKGDFETSSALVEQRDERVQELIGENSQLAQNLANLKIRSEEISKQAIDLDRQRSQVAADFDSIENLLLELTTTLSRNRTSLSQREQRITELDQLTRSNESKIDDWRKRRRDVAQKLTSSKIELAKSQQLLANQTAQQEQIAGEADSISEELARVEDHTAADAKSAVQAEKELKFAQDQLTGLESELSTLSSELNHALQEKDRVDNQRRDVAGELQNSRDELRGIEDKLHKAELKSSHLNLERNKLLERLQEDYGIDAADLESELEDETEIAQREAIDEEISQLRQKIGSIGSVNMDALAELEDLEQRYTKMDEQYQDLVSAKQSLENIIQRINTDSRRLFVETLEAIRSNFQVLYRQTFGGGKADIILEEGVDPLEAGVEIVATPPGKPEFSNSLLSGGEKALTAVSLLMAIFQFRPSPFCVLDEVDAPFDEANIGRFIDVLKSFLGWTKFVIVTHSKKTMTAATTLYGVTMQESGVSKRVSVRFEDVGEDGQISQAAVNRDDDERGVA